MYGAPSVFDLSVVILHIYAFIVVVVCTAYVHTCVWVFEVCIHAKTSRCPALSLSSEYFETGSLAESWAKGELISPSYPPACTAIAPTSEPCPAVHGSFYVAAMDLNTGLHVYATNALTIEPSPLVLISPPFLTPAMEIFFPVFSRSALWFVVCLVLTTGLDPCMLLSHTSHTRFLGKKLGKFQEPSSP